MAEKDIVGGMFGITPEMYQQNRQQQQMAEAIKMGSLTPEQFIGTQAYRGGQMAGNVLGGLLGVEDPQLGLIRQTNQLVQQIGVDTPEKLKTLAGELQKLPGGASLAAQAIDKANKMLESEATVKQKTGENINSLISSGKYTPESLGIFSNTRNPADLQLIDKGLTGTALDKVASAEQNIQNISAGNAEIDSWINKVNPKNPSVTFGPVSTVGGGLSRLVGSPTDNAIEQDRLRRFVSREANAILMAAKGTQTEGDAQRAYDMIMSGLDKNSNEGVQAALEDLKDMKATTVKGLKTYVETVKGKGKTTPTREQPAVSGEYADDYAKYKQKYGTQALPYEAYVRRRTGQ